MKDKKIKLDGNIIMASNPLSSDSHIHNHTYLIKNNSKYLIDDNLRYSGFSKSYGVLFDNDNIEEMNVKYVNKINGEVIEDEQLFFGAKGVVQIVDGEAEDVTEYFDLHSINIVLK